MKLQYPSLLLILLVAFLAIWPTSSQAATSCATNCDKQCTVTFNRPGMCTGKEFGIEFNRPCTKRGREVDPACRQRCFAERKLACEYRLNFCSFWRANTQYHQGVAALRTLKRSRVLRSYRDCETMVNLTATGKSLAGYGRKALEFFKILRASAKATLKASIVGYAAEEMVIHGAKCACDQVFSGADVLVPPSESSVDTFHIHFRHRCRGRTLRVAVRIKHPTTGKWITKGWYTVPTVTAGTVKVAGTKNRIYYFYAESIVYGNQPKARWTGRDRIYVVKGKRYGFKRHRTDNSKWGDHIHTLTCR